MISVNHCAKCKSKFTSPEKPLKLLPCLHSMCIDCLYGRPPAKTKAKSESEDSTLKNNNNGVTQDQSAKGEKVQEVSEEGQEEEPAVDKVDNGESDTGKDKLEEETKNKGESDTADQEGTKESPKQSGENSADSVNSETGAKQDVNGSDANNEDIPGHSSGDSEINKEKTSTLETEPADGDVQEVEAEASTSKDAPKTSSPLVEDLRNEEEEVKLKPVTECPVCRDPIEQPCVGLLDNMFASLDPEEGAELSAEVNHVCTGCEDGQTAEMAESYCMQCEEWLCSSCVHAHRRVRVTKDHVISPKDEVKVVSSRSPWEYLMTCRQHKQEQLKFFCEKCEKLTCRDCQLMDHKDHKYQFLDQAAEQYKAKLKGSLALMGEKRSKLATNKDEIQQKLTNCKDQKDSLQQEILKQADVLVKGIRQAVWAVISNLHSFTEAATKRLNKEIDDVSDLVTKFDHCIHFMEDILNESSSMSLLYSKGNVEAKCRKVYHTQVDPQSLKGTLLIQYKHDVNWLLGNLGKIGAIFVNGVRYPPDKTGAQNRQAAHGFSEGGRGMATTSPHLQHMANQTIPGQRVPHDWNKFLHNASKQSSSHPNGPPNMTINSMGGSSALPPQLALPNRRGSHAPQWQGMSDSRTFPGNLVAGQLLTPQQQASRPNFTPMRLNTRPATQQGDNSPGVMRSPPQYRAGGEASGTSRSSSSHGTPDPARPASAGMYDGNNSRPDSGGPAMVDIKTEKRDLSPDCVIMSTNMKADRPVFQTTPPTLVMSDLSEMQKNLDEVLRAVPMDMSDNLEQISQPTSAPRPPNKTPTTSPPPLLSNSTTAPSSAQKDSEAPVSPTDQELRDNWQGGNSMPGFSLSQAGVSGDPNDDYCACCHNGGDVLCCDQCPRVYHLQCHIPELAAVPTGSFVCTLCGGDRPVGQEDALKRKAPGGLTDHEVEVCERILLELFCHPSSVPFQEPVNRVQVPNYYKIISQPMDFTQIKCKLQRRHHNHYQSLKAFLYDLRQVFINCALYNKAGSEVGKAGKIVRDQFESLVERLLSQHLTFVRENPSPCFSAVQNIDDLDIDSGASSPKRAKQD